MNGQAWSGNDLLGALRHAAAMLEAEVDEVNALNVFPVPDGDTGSNMLATVRAAVAEAEALPEAERTLAKVGAAVRLGALMGARGNSGVILSQILRGLADAVATVPAIGGRTLADALQQGSRAAFAAVAEPVAGTMLTVAQDAADAAAQVARDSDDLDLVLSAAVDEAAASVKRTPSLLPVLRRAGVVDAGGRGLELLLRGALASVHADHLPPHSRLPHDIALPDYDELEADGYGYETVFIVQPEANKVLDVEAIRRRLPDFGESVLVAGDERALKIHVHNDRPDDVIAYGLSLGTLSRINVENLDRQASDVLERAHRGIAPAPAEDLTQQSDDRAVIAVAAGRGLAHVFGTLGVNGIIDGGQGRNPSAGELADAIHGTGAREVIVLPNNPNVQLAAEQAAELCPDVAVAIVPTRNAGEGVAAMLALDPDRELSQAVAAMSDAARSIQTLQATVAVREAHMGRRKIKRGDYVVLEPGDGIVAAGVNRTVAILEAIQGLKPGFELLTVYRGDVVDHDAGESLVEALRAALDGAEIQLIDGGQPHYEFLITAE